MVNVFPRRNIIKMEFFRKRGRFRLRQRISNVGEPPSHHASEGRSFCHFIPFHLIEINVLEIYTKFERGFSRKRSWRNKGCLRQQFWWSREEAAAAYSNFKKWKLKHKLSYKQKLTTSRTQRGWLKSAGWIRVSSNFPNWRWNSKLAGTEGIRGQRKRRKRESKRKKRKKSKRWYFALKFSQRSNGFPNLRRGNLLRAYIF